MKKERKFFRGAEISDIQAIMELAAPHVEKGWLLPRKEEEIRTSIWNEELLLLFEREKKKEVLLGCSGGRVLNNKVAELYFFVVRGGRGLESGFDSVRLLKERLKRLKEVGITEAYFFTEKSNPLINTVFKRCGFEIIPEEKLLSELPPEMQKELVFLKKENRNPIAMKKHLQ